MLQDLLRRLSDHQCRQQCTRSGRRGSSHPYVRFSLAGEELRQTSQYVKVMFVPPLAASLKPIERLVNDEYVPFLLPELRSSDHINLFFPSCLKIGVSNVSLPNLEPI